MSAPSGSEAVWATIHDLRIEVDGLVVQVDHLIINRLAQVWVCESKSFAEGVSVNEHGEWTRWWNGRPDGIPSPIEQNRRHVHLLGRAFEDGLVNAPRRLGVVPVRPAIRSPVLVSNGARIGRPKRKVNGLDQVIKAEALKTRLYDELEKVPGWRLAGMIGKEGLKALAEDLAALPRPSSVDWAGPERPADVASSPHRGRDKAGAMVNDPRARRAQHEYPEGGLHARIPSRSRLRWTRWLGRQPAGSVHGWASHSA